MLPSIPQGWPLPRLPCSWGPEGRGRDGLYGNPEKRMPSLLICIQTVSFAYRQASSAYAQWDSESTFLSVPPGPSHPSPGIPVEGGGPPHPSALVCVWVFLFPKGRSPSRAPLPPAVAGALLPFRYSEKSSSHLLVPAPTPSPGASLPSQEAVSGGPGLAAVTCCLFAPRG